MASNSFGQIFRFTTWGESHGKAVGVVIDGAPAGLALSEEMINLELAKRAPGKKFTSKRKEADQAQILSGLFEGKTTGTPISIIVYNKDARSGCYDAIQGALRPGHANYTYQKKYGCFDHRGGGRASARETVGRVAAGGVAKAFLRQSNCIPKSTLIEVGGESDPTRFEDCLEEALNQGDSLGGIIETRVQGMAVGLGEPIYYKLEAALASAMLSLPACKGFEIGAGFHAAKMSGSVHNDPFIIENGEIRTVTNHAGGTLAGISNGMELVFRVAFKPTSSIKKAQKTVDMEGESCTIEHGAGHRHDPCVALRAAPIVEAMTACVLTDLVLLDRTRRCTFL